MEALFQTTLSVGFPIYGVKIFELNVQTVLVAAGFCFTGNTDISLLDGKKQIKDIGVEVKVLSYNHEKKEVIPNKVTKLFKCVTGT